MATSRRARGPGRPPAAESRDRVADLVVAARRRFTEDGYGGATLAAIAADAGLTPAALYRYFPDKAAIFERVYRETMEASWVPWIAALESVDPATSLGDKLRVGGNLADAADEASVAFITPAQIHARRVPELRHLLDERRRYRSRAFELLVGTLAEEGRIRGATSTGEAVEMLEVIFTGWTFETSFQTERTNRYFESAITIVDALSVEP